MNQDVWIITTQGIVPISALFQTDPEQVVNVISRPINPLLSSFAGLGNFGARWHGFFWSDGRRAYINIPDSTDTSAFLVYSIDTKAWTKFTLFNGQHNYFACVFNSLPYYGSYDGKIYKGETNYADFVVGTDGGQPIAFSGQMAFSYYGSRGNYKAFKDIRPLIKSRRGLTFNLALDTDFKEARAEAIVTTPSSKYTPWGSPWGSPWSSDVEFIYDRYATAGQGHCAAIRFSGAVKNSPCQFLGFEIRYVLGGQV
jgi:hypothetical protein